MSIGPTPPAGNISGAPLAQQRAGESDQSKAAADQQRAVQNDRRSAEAEGIGQTSEDAETEDRDADGRVPGRRTARRGEGTASGASPDADASGDPPASRDPDGTCGNQLDLSG